MKNVVTSFVVLPTAEGRRISFTYSVVDEDGNLVKSNVRHTVIITDNEIESAADMIFDWLLNKIPQ